jgi:hypothetical protein
VLARSLNVGRREQSTAGGIAQWSDDLPLLEVPQGRFGARNLPGRARDTVK